MTSIARSTFWVPLVFVMASSGLRAQEAHEIRGLEVDDPSRLGVSLIPGLGLDREVVERVVAEEFDLAGVEITDQNDPQENEVLVIWIGETVSVSGEPGRETTFSLSNYRLEFWRPVRYEAGGEDRHAPGMTWVTRGEATGGYAPGWTTTQAVCEIVSQMLREFLTSFRKANGGSYTPPENPPPACGRQND